MSKMIHVKCRYNEIYCGCKTYLMNNRAKLCNPNECGDVGECAEFDYLWVAGEYVVACEHAKTGIIEFEKDVKGYEYNKEENTLVIGRHRYLFIEYLEIDGRVLVNDTEDDE